MPPGTRSPVKRTVAGLTLAAALLGLFYLFLGLNHQTNWPPARSDGEGYFAYLPLAFVYHTTDVTVLTPAQGTGQAPAGTFFVEKTGRWNIKYPIGIALTAAPFYAAAHLFCLATHGRVWPADGYSLPYQLALPAAGLLAFAVGLWAMGRWLSRRFAPEAVAAALVFIAFATNLAHYATFDSFASHIYSVAAIALFLDALDRFAARPTVTRAALLGVIAGYGFLTRNTTVIYFVPLFFLPLLGGRLPLWEWLRSVAVACGAGLLTILPQLLLWKYWMGSFIAYSYGDERFSNLGDPLFSNVFWSWRKGAFLHFPFLLLPVAGLGLAFLLSRRSQAAPLTPVPPAAPLRLEAGVALACGLVQSYIAASWSTWPYGGSLGHRAFVDFYPLLVLGAAWLAARGIEAGRARTVRVVVVAAVVYAQVFTQLYWFHFVKSDGMTRADFAKLPKAAATDLPARLAGTFYDAGFDCLHPRNTSRLDWWKETRAVLSASAPARIEGEAAHVSFETTNTGTLTLKNWGRRGNILVRATLTGADGLPRALPPKQFLPSPVDPGQAKTFSLAYRLPKKEKDPLPAGPYRLTLSLWHGQKDSLTALGLANDLDFEVALAPSK